MFLTMLVLATLFLTSIFSADTVVTTLVGAAATLGLTRYLKDRTGWRGLAAFALAAVSSVVIAIVAQAAQLALGGNFSFEALAGSGAVIFGTATIAYNALTAKQ